jgi:hypothetical protein
MKLPHSPRPLILIILIFLGIAFLSGTLRLFRTVEAAPAAQATTATETVAGLTPTPVPARIDADRTIELVPPPVLVSADTSGIIALAAVIVVTVLVGATWGVRRTRQKPNHPE